mgnify:CR=1 FL=1
MRNLTKYVLGVAAKSNIEKRQVGCIIVGDHGRIYAEGFNDEESHAEAHACEDLIAEGDYNAKLNGKLTAYVTHQPCPACAKLLIERNVEDVVIVDAFMKFDTDKLRFDLIDGSFGNFILDLAKFNMPVPAKKIKSLLYSYSKYPEEKAGFVYYLKNIIDTVASQYADFNRFETGLATVLTFGASKYKANNWRKCTDTGRYLAACHRHLNAILCGEELDPETGFRHWDHISTNLMFLYTLGLHYDD